MDELDEHVLQEALKAAREAVSPLVVCYEEPVPSKFSGTSSYNVFCCKREERKLEGSGVTTICEQVENKFELVEILEAISVLFLIFQCISWLQETFQHMIHKVRTDSLIFSYISSDITVCLCLSV